MICLSLHPTLLSISSMMSRDFIRACQDGNVNMVISALADPIVDPNELYDPRPETFSTKTSGFIEACSHGHSEIVSLLLKDSRIDVNQAKDNGWTGFIYACYNRHTETVLLLLKDARVDVNKQDNTGATGFIHACHNERTELLSLLLNSGRIDVNQQDNDGWTGYMQACAGGRTAIVSELSKSERVDCLCGWKGVVNRTCRRLSQTVMNDGAVSEHGSLYDMWRGLQRIGSGVFLRGWSGDAERVKKPWICGAGGEGENKRSEEMRKKRESDWREVCDYLLEEDSISVLIVCHYSKRIQLVLNARMTVPRDMKERVREMESM